MADFPDSGVIAWIAVETERKLQAERDARERALAAAPTDLKRALVRFFIELRDYGESVELQRTERASLLHIVDTRSLAAAAVSLAAAVKKEIPELRVPELLHLESELLIHHGKHERGQDIHPTLRQRLQDALALGRELHLIPDRPRASDRRRKTPRKARPQGNAAAGYDMMALKLAQELDAKGLPWSITSIAAKLKVSRSTLNGMRANGKPRCPHFMKEAKKRRNKKVSYIGTVNDMCCNEETDDSAAGDE